jgi:hypothetical protein
MITFRGDNFTVTIPQTEWPQDTAEDENVDVLVATDDGRHYAATAYTIRNIAYLMDRRESYLRPANEVYFCDSSWIIVRSINESVIRTAVADLLANGLIERAFEKAEKPE